MNKLLELLPQMKNKKVLVIGDIMLDKYIWGSVKRISPEAPVQIVGVEKESYMPGGAGNSANNIASLGGIPYLVGVVGNDEPQSILLQELQNRCINTEGAIKDDSMQTIQKVRVVAKNQQLLRIDYEKNIHLNEKQEHFI